MTVDLRRFLYDLRENPTRTGHDLQFQLFAKTKGLGRRYRMVLRMVRVPTRQEFRRTIAVTMLGAVIVGGVGFLIYYVMEFMLPPMARWLELTT